MIVSVASLSIANKRYKIIVTEVTMLFYASYCNRLILASAVWQIIIPHHMSCTSFHSHPGAELALSWVRSMPLFGYVINMTPHDPVYDSVSDFFILSAHVYDVCWSLDPFLLPWPWVWPMSLYWCLSLIKPCQLALAFKPALMTERSWVKPKNESLQTVQKSFAL